jgi:hypothetical protein
MIVCEICGAGERVIRYCDIALCMICRRIDEVRIVPELRQKVLSLNGHSVLPYPKIAQIMMMKEARNIWQRKNIAK